MKKIYDDEETDYEPFPSVEDADEMEEEYDHIFSRFCDN